MYSLATLVPYPFSATRHTYQFMELNSIWAVSGIADPLR